MGQDGSGRHSEPPSLEVGRARLQVGGNPLPRRSFRPPLPATPEREPGFPLDILADDVSKQTAVRLYADELAWRFRLVALMSRQLERLEAIAEARLTMRSTDAALALAIIKTAKFLDETQEKLRSLTPESDDNQVEGIIEKLAFLTGRLTKLRGRSIPQAVVVEPPAGALPDVTPSGTTPDS